MLCDAVMIFFWLSAIRSAGLMLQKEAVCGFLWDRGWGVEERTWPCFQLALDAPNFIDTYHETETSVCTRIKANSVSPFCRLVRAATHAVTYR
ncbi:hypothetical protein V8C26DRAFT_397793 [Trichoderma gracile]